MKKRSAFLLLVVPSLLFACTAPVTPAPTASPEPTSTALPTATHTPTTLPTATQTEPPKLPTETPGSPTRTEGSYLAYFQEVKGIRRLVFMDAHSSRRRVIELPGSISNSLAPAKPFDLDARLISPDGHWLAFYTGSAGSYGRMPARGTSDLTLQLLDLTTGEEQVITPLLSQEYPDNFIEAAAQLNDPDITAESLHDAFVHGITEAFAWSPDAQYLAFAGQMDGLSSDLYVYDVKAETIRRLSSGPQELQWIEWSPDGKWILHSSLFSVGVGMTFDLYAASLGSTSVPYLSTNIMHDGIDQWLNSHQYFENDGENVIGEYGLRLVDIDTGNITRLWDGSFRSYAHDPDGKWLIVNAFSPDMSPESYTGTDSTFVPGPYLINLSTLQKTKIEFPSKEISLDYTALPFGLGDQIFIFMSNDSADSYFLGGSLEFTPLALKQANVAVSPNREYWIAITTRDVSIFSADNTLIKQSTMPLANSFVGDVLWRPDSSGVVLVSESRILLMDVPTGEIKVVESSLMNDNYNQAYRWVDGQ